MERFHISNFVVQVKLSNSEHPCLVTCCTCCCGCLLCFLAGRGGGVPFKGKGWTDGAGTSGQGADGSRVIGWGERVEGNINPEQTGDLCFTGERKSIYVSIWNERIRQRNEINNLIILFCILIKKSQMMGSIFQFSLLLKSHFKQCGSVRRYFNLLLFAPPQMFLEGMILKKKSTLHNTTENKMKLEKRFKLTILRRVFSFYENDARWEC